VDVAIGTTYSLDLMALLAVPLAFALFDWEDDSGKVTADPLALLEAARRFARKTHIFCQEGQIHLPKQRSPLFYELERVVKEVRAPNNRGIFHPKVWVLRFTPTTKGDPVLYRLLCLSRNLTYDRSWDTVLRLDGELLDRDLAIAANHPLGDFIKELPKRMIQQPAEDELRKTVSKLQDEVRRVRFTLPDGVEQVRFHPLGLGLEEIQDWWFPGRCEQLLAVAPFVDGITLKRFASKTQGKCKLVSRLEQLQELPGDLLAKFADVFYLHPNASEMQESEAAASADDQEPDKSDATDDAATETLTGLHAKLYITDAGWKSSLWTGSANATSAAFSRNVEFLVELVGKKCDFGVDAFLKHVKGQTRFADLLHKFEPQEIVVEKDAEARAAEKLAEHVRAALLALSIKAIVSPIPDSPVFNMVLSGTATTGARFQPESVAISCWPVTLPEREAVDGLGLVSSESISFPRLTFEALTAFMAFDVRADVGKCNHRLRFVLNLPVEGLPTDRPERMFRLILQDKKQVMRMLLLLLADSGADALIGSTHAHGISDDDRADNEGHGLGDLALFEPLLRTLEHSPAKLTRVARLISDLEKTPGGTELLPLGFMQIWTPIWTVAQRLVNENKTN
jgi:hypothetical protein